MFDTDIKDVFNDGKSLLHIACVSSNTKAVAWLINEGISLRTLDNNGKQTNTLFQFNLKSASVLADQMYTQPSLTSPSHLSSHHYVVL